jgi:hypothetical protein
MKEKRKEEEGRLKRDNAIRNSIENVVILTVDNI